jgi:hypothetical protein
MVSRQPEKRHSTKVKYFKQANVHQRICSTDTPPHLLGYFPDALVGRTMHMSELEKELRTRNITFEPTLKVTKKCNLLKKDKLRWL